MSAISGVGGYVMQGETEYPFNKWSTDITCEVVKASNFKTGKFKKVLPGMFSATLTLESQAYDTGGINLTAGEYYDFILGYAEGIELEMTVMVSKISSAVDLEGQATVKIDGESDGEFSVEIA